VDGINLGGVAQFGGFAAVSVLFSGRTASESVFLGAR
jgi:hypothetical protein